MEFYSVYLIVENISSLNANKSYTLPENWWQIDSKLSKSITKPLSSDLSFDIYELLLWIEEERFEGV